MIAVEKDVSAAVFGLDGDVVVGVVADFLLLLRRSWSDGGLSSAGENSILL